MATFNKFNSFVEAVAEKLHNLGTDTLRFYLTNVAPVATNTIKTDIAEIAAGNGYTAGGVTAAQTSSAQASGTYRLILADPALITAGPAAMATFRYAVLYNDTALNDELIGWFDYGAAITLGIGETFQIDCDPATGVLTLT